VAAVDLAESLLQQETATSSTTPAPATTNVTAKTTVDGIELAADLISFPVPPTNLRFVELVDGPPLTTKGILTHTSGNATEISLRATSKFSNDGYGDSALQGLLRLLEDLALARQKRRRSHLVTDFMVSLMILL